MYLVENEDWLAESNLIEASAFGILDRGSGHPLDPSPSPSLAKGAPKRVRQRALCASIGGPD